jgi:glycosyltransferase involved in cell wall biosynthesis
MNYAASVTAAQDRVSEARWAERLPGDPVMTGSRGRSRWPALRIGLVAPPFLPVPPPAYGGTERVVHALAEGLHALGHDVTLFASADSDVSCRLVATVPRACWTGGSPDVDASFERVLEAVTRDQGQFDVIHSHLERKGFTFAESNGTPVVSTMHGRLDDPLTRAALLAHPAVALVAISESQQAQAPWAHWVGVVRHGLDMRRMPFGRTGGDYLLFVGRITGEKGIVEAIEVARRTRHRLVIAAKIFDRTESDLFESEVRPALCPGRVEYLGEVGPAVRDPLFAGAVATLMLGDWPEPFGLVAIESLATGTPVIALRRGALPEIVEDGFDGFLVDDVEGAERAVALVRSLDRRRIRSRAIRRFSAARMVDDYLAVYRRVLDSPTRARRATRQVLAP